MKRMLVMLAIVLVPGRLAAQPAQESTPEPRFVVQAGAGYGTTWDDEGLLGRGLGVAAGAGVRVAPRLTIVGFVDRVRYYRDVEWLTVDGRAIFAGAEASLRFSRQGTTPYVTAGVGVLNDSGIWIRKDTAGPSQPRMDDRIDRAGSAATMTASGGLEIPVSRRAAVRAGARFYGLLDTGDDLFPHVMIQPAAALVLGW